MKNKEPKLQLKPVLKEGTVYYDGKYYKDLIGFISNMNTNIDSISEVTFITVDNQPEIENNYIKEIKIEKNSTNDCLFFRIENILYILEKYNIQEKYFRIKINIENQILESENIVNIIYR